MTERLIRRTAFIAALPLVVTLGVRVAAQQPPGQQPPGQQAPAAPTGPLAPEKFKNIQVLKELPADDLDGVMRFMSASLGVQCQFCHVTTETGNWPMDKDDKRAKQTARQMITMVKAINDQSFNGRPQITCATCHTGHQRPDARPPLAVEMTPDQIAEANARAALPPAPPPAAPPAGSAPGAAPGRGGPGRGGPPRPTETLDEIADKYVQASGGRDALAKINSRVMKGTLTTRAGQTVPVTVEEKAPGRYRQTLETKDGATVRAFDGTAAWQQDGKDLWSVKIPFEQQQVARLADLGLPLQVKDRYQNLTVTRYDKIDGKDVIVVQGRTAPTVTEQLSFDKNSGLLVRRVVSTRTAMGNLPEQIDYSDYRDVGGVKVPFQIRRASWDFVMASKFTDVKVNVPVDDARFAMPSKQGGL